MKIKGIFTLLAACAFITAEAQQIISLQQVVELAQKQSPAVKLAQTVFENKYWRYRSFQSNYRPQLSLNGTLPNLQRDIIAVTQDDGTDLFVSRSLASSSLDLSLAQNVGLSGGSVFVNSRLSRIDILGDNPGVSYLSNPITVGFQQPLLRYNSLKWDRRVEPLKYREASREFNEAMEQVAVRACGLFFDLLIAQISLEIARNNEADSDTLYKISQGRYNLGKIAENGLLEMELSLMNSRIDVAQAEMDVQTRMNALRNFLKLPVEGTIALEIPDVIPEVNVIEQKALEQARNNRRDPVTFQRQRMEAQQAVARAKGESGLNVDVFALYGLTQSAVGTDPAPAYSHPQNRQQAMVGVSIPLIDWGKARSEIRTQRANKELMDLQIEQAEQQFDQEVLMLVRTFQMNSKKVVIARSSDEIAQKRYDLSVSRYMVGKIGITELNIALDEKDIAKRSYLQALREYWESYYNLRRQTLYDFRNGRPIQNAFLPD